MNYPKSIRKAAMGRRVIMLIGIAVFFGLVVGGILGYALKAHITFKDREKGWVHIKRQDDIKTLVYGAYDDRCFTEEASLDWESDLDFISIDCQMPEEQQEFVFYLCAGYNIDFSLAMALIQCESNFDPNIISSTNDYGYMQINVQNHEWLTRALGVTDYTDPYQNIRAGMFMLRKLFERYQNTDMVLMAYNMGEKGAARLWEQGIYSTCYTEIIFSTQRRIIEELEEGDCNGNVESS